VHRTARRRDTFSESRPRAALNKKRLNACIIAETDFSRFRLDHRDVLGMTGQ
jgi:hypothetical protein